MARADILNIMYSKEKSPLEFNFDSLWVPSMYNYITPQDVFELNRIATSNRYSAKIELKYQAIDSIMVRRGFKKFHCGTNRIVYKYLEDERFLLKIALDDVGLGDNPREYKNQFLLKPFVTKMFECSPCGTVAMVERVQPITSRQEFASVADSVYELLTNVIIGQYVLEDIGSKYFMNYGLRNGMGVVLLDYPYLFELDGNKLYCNLVDKHTGIKCSGVIDYDNGFNNLVCSHCGKLYLAQELEISVKEKLILMKDEGELDMKITVKRGNKEIIKYDSSLESEVMVRKPKTMKPAKFKVSIHGKLMEEDKKLNRTDEKDNNTQISHNNKTRDDYNKNNKKKFASDSSRFQNRKNNNSNTRTEKFNNKFNKFKSDSYNENNIEDEQNSYVKYDEKLYQDNREIVQEESKEQNNIEITQEEIQEQNNNEIVQEESKEEIQDVKDDEIYKAFGLTEEDFEDPKDLYDAY